MPSYWPCASGCACAPSGRSSDMPTRRRTSTRTATSARSQTASGGSSSRKRFICATRGPEPEMRKLRAHERDTGAAAGRRYCQYRRYRRGTRDVAPARCADRGCRARGAALVTGLVLLLVLTILGVAAMSTAALEIVIAGNAQFQHDAFALAENAVDTVI